jgi:radical SAM-linked protein
LKLAYSGGFHPMPKVVFGCALPVGTESMQETVVVELTECLDPSFLRKRINRQLPHGITITSVKRITPGKKKQRIKESHFVVSLNEAELNKSDLEKFLESDYFPIVKKGKKGDHKINARALVKSMTPFSLNGITLIVRHTTGPEARPAEIVKRVFSLEESQVNHMKILKTKQILW